MRESSCDVILDLFTKGSHHKNISVIFIMQNIFHKGKSQRDIRLNTKYIVLYKNPRDRAQIQHLARQVHPEDPNFCKTPTSTPRTLRIRIFFSIYRKTVWMNLDFVRAYFPTTKRTTLMYQNIQSFDSLIIFLKKERWEWVKQETK